MTVGVLKLWAAGAKIFDALQMAGKKIVCPCTNFGIFREASE